MSTRRAFLSLTLTVAALAALPALAAAVEDPAAPMFDPSTVDVIELKLPPTSIEALEAEPGAYVPGTFEIAKTDGTPGGVGAFSAPLKVEIRLKGSTSFRELDDKSAFKLKFKKTERYLGLKKMTLNNMVQDPSMTHETLSYAAFRASGVPAPRTGFAYLYVNGEDFGLELNVETMDDLALEKRFGAFKKPPQHLYEGASGADVEPGRATDFEVDEGDEADLSDLEALIGAANSTGPEPWSTRIDPFADLGEMTTMWAVEKYVGQWDGYSGRDGAFQPNNYYLYSDPSGRFQMIPWGTDETWLQSRPVTFDGRAGLLFNECLEDPICEALYRESLGAAAAAIAGLDLRAQASELAATLGPWQQLEAGNDRREHSLHEIREAVAATRRFIAARPAQVSDFLNPPSGEPGPAGTPPPPSPTTTNPAPEPAPERLLRVGRLELQGSALHTDLHVSAAGELDQRATISIGGEPVHACGYRMQVAGARTVDLRCPLTPAVRERLRAHWLRLTVTTRFSAAAGAAETAVRRVTLPRG
jgi:hypothetical protein